MPYVVGPRVLEIGCGPGHLVVDLSAAGYHGVGIDRSPEMWRQASRRLARAGYPDRVIAADARALPFCDQMFDSVIMTFPTPVVRDPSLWREAARVLRPGSPLVVVLGARPDSRRWSGGHERSVMAASRRRAKSAPKVGSDRSISVPELAIPIPERLFVFRAVEVETEGATIQVIIAMRLPS